MSGATTATSHKSGRWAFGSSIGACYRLWWDEGQAGSYPFGRRISTDKRPFSVLCVGIVVYPKVDLWPHPLNAQAA
jgi:hypothetical protein